MTDVVLPAGLVEGRRTPRFGSETLPPPLREVHETTVWGELVVERGSVRFAEPHAAGRDLRVDGPDSVVIPPGVPHEVEPSTDAVFFVQFYRPPGAPLVPGDAVTTADARRRSGPWQPRHRDLDTPGEIFELVTRQYVDVVQDDLLGPYFHIRPGFTDWQAHIGQVADYWCHVLLYAPGYDIDTIANHGHVHAQRPLTAESFDRWLQIFGDTVDGGWRGPLASQAKKRATGMAWAMAQRYLGHGVWRPAAFRTDSGGSDGD